MNAIFFKDEKVHQNTHYPTHHPCNVDDATMDPISDEQSPSRSRRLSRRQMEKAPQPHSPDNVDYGRLSFRQVQQSWSSTRNPV